MNTLSREKMAAVLFALARLTFCCYRAAHQSIVIDEAFSFGRFVKGPWSSIYSQYDASNHVLYSIFAKLSIQAFGLSEFTFRLPSVISGFFLILGVFWVLERTTSRLIRWTAMLAFSLYPLLTDFSIAARGYGMGLAFLIWAIYFSIGRRYLVAGTLLGLAVSSNLTNVFPALGLMCAVVLLDSGSLSDRFRSLFAILAPAENLFGAICFASLRSARRGNFYVGYATLRQSLFELIYVSVRVAHRSGLFGTYNMVCAIEIFLLPVVAIFILMAAGCDFARNRENRQRLIPALTLVASVLGLMAAHYLFDLNYPVDRTGLYLALLFGIAWAIAADGVRSMRSRRIQALAVCLVIVQLGTQFETSYFAVWKFDKDARAIAQKLKAACTGKAADSVSVSATWIYQPALEFYREDLHITALQAVERRDPTVLSGHNFYVLNELDASRIGNRGLRVLFSDPDAGVVLAEPGN